jgi:hypothetical protein
MKLIYILEKLKKYDGFLYIYLEKWLEKYNESVRDIENYDNNKYNSIVFQLRELMFERFGPYKPAANSTSNAPASNAPATNAQASNAPAANTTKKTFLSNIQERASAGLTRGFDAAAKVLRGQAGGSISRKTKKSKKRRGTKKRK